MLILDLWGISFHAVIVFGLGKKLLFKSVLRHCDNNHCVATFCTTENFLKMTKKSFKITLMAMSSGNNFVNLLSFAKRSKR